MTRRIGAGVLTGAAVLLVLVALTFPDRLDQLHPSAFLRLPVEALVYLVVVLLIPARLHALRTGLALVAGLLLGLTMILRLLDMGFLQALNRPFDVVIDWTYTRDLIELVRDSFGKGLGTVMLLVAAVLAIGLLVLLPLAVLRLTRLTVGHRQAGLRTVAALVTVWLVLAVMDVRVSTGDVASRDTSGYLYGQVSRIPSVLRDQRQFDDRCPEGLTAPVPGRRPRERVAREGRPVRLRGELRPGRGRGLLALDQGIIDGPRFGVQASRQGRVRRVAARS